MSLNFDLTKVQDCEERCYCGEDGAVRLSTVTNRIVWGAMSADIGHLKTVADCREYHRRYCEFAWACGDTPDLTLEDVLAHQGLHVNVHKTSETQWRKKLALTLRDRYHRHMRGLETAKSA